MKSIFCTNSKKNTMKKIFTLLALTITFNMNAQTDNTSTGTSALNSISTGDNNSAFGVNALTANSSGGANTAIGKEALYSNTTSSSSTAVGNYSLKNSNGFYNTAVGTYSLYGNTSGARNVGIGLNSLFTNTTGSYNTAIGYETYASAADATNQTVIGYQATGQANNSVVLGNDDVTAVYMGEDSGATVYAGEGSFTGDMTIEGDDLTIGDLSAFSGSFTQRSAIDVVAHSDGDLMTGYINGSTGDRFNIELDAGNSLAKISSGGGYDLTFSTEGGTMNFESNGFETGTYAFNGNTTVSNDLTVSGDVVVSSDARLKANIVSLGSTLSRLLLIDGKSYTMIKDGKQKIGVLAQEIKKVFPELVSEDANKMLAVNYQGLVPVLINALKEQQVEINKLKKQEQRLEKLEKLIYQMNK